MKSRILLLTFVIYSSLLFCQIEVKPKEFDAVKNGKTYFIVTNKEFSNVKAYETVLKKFWNLTPIEVINESEMGKYMEEGNLYFRFHKIITQLNNKNNIQLNKSILVPFGQNTGGFYPRPGQMGYTKEDVFLDLFSFDKKFIEKFKEKERSYMLMDINEIARLAISLPSDQMIISDKDFFMFNDLANNWQPGYLKNYLQYIQMAIKTGESKKMINQIFESKLSSLVKDTLFIPANIENNMSDKDIDSGKKLFENYSFPYKLISSTELSEKILNSKTSFYYLLFIHSKPEKFIEIIDSGTGEIIYSNMSTSQYIKQKDFKDLDKEIRNKQ